MPHEAMTSPAELFPVTQATVERAYEFVFAPWVKALGLLDFKVERGRVSADRGPLKRLDLADSSRIAGQGNVRELLANTVIESYAVEIAH